MGKDKWVGGSIPRGHDGVFSGWFDLDRSLGGPSHNYSILSTWGFISGEQSNEPALTQFVVYTRRSTKVEDIKESNFGTYLDYAMWVFIIYFQYILNFWVQ